MKMSFVSVCVLFFVSVVGCDAKIDIGEPDSGTFPDVSIPLSDSGTDSGSEEDAEVNEPDSGLFTLPSGSVCEENNECQSDVCTSLANETDRVCADKPEFGSCTYDSDCPHDEFCCVWRTPSNRLSGWFCLHRESVIGCGPENEE